MKTLARVCCLLYVVSLLTIFISAEEYKEDFIQPGSSYCTLTNLQKCSKDIGKLFLIGIIPDASGYVLQDYTEVGSAVFKVSGAQNVSIGYYTIYGPYVERSLSDGMYRLCTTATDGKKLIPLYDASSKGLCFQDIGKIFYLSYQSTGDIIFAELNKAIAPEVPKLSKAYLNVYCSEDGNTFSQTGTNIVRCLYGDQLNTVSNNVYCEAVAQIPKGSRYIKIEINQPSRIVMEESQWVSIKPNIATLLANVTFTGEKLVMGEYKDTNPSSQTSSSLPQINNPGYVSDISTSQSSAPSLNSNSQIYEAGTAGKVIMAVGRVEHSDQTASSDLISIEDKPELTGSNVKAMQSTSVFSGQTSSSYEGKATNTNNILQGNAGKDYSKVIIFVLGIIIILMITYTVKKAALSTKKARALPNVPKKEEVNKMGKEPPIVTQEPLILAHKSHPSTDEDALSAEYWLF
ncbi:hypothetical protein [Acetanaerobacterium elongatum]|uniref:Uncharacterized protein n=1 Tax=Acetanaerobacterium elongatum TaxID=258515 RepID=A0A1G9X4P3_9FIRM|nr:hypothetical protein [Acetanaerobacterium elongatum]SDM91456.1 hypothetical protein SAMN05192585_10783 [Acetanaerobacterium elongatum]